MERKKTVQAQIKALQKQLYLIDHKCWYYKTAMEAGTESIHFTKNSDDLSCL